MAKKIKTIKKEYSTKKWFILGILAALIAGGLFLLLTQRVNAEEQVNGGYWTEWKDTTRCIVSECGTTKGTKGQSRDYMHKVCDTVCPTFEFRAKECPAGYKEPIIGNKCWKLQGHKLVFADYLTFGPIQVTYNKSQDPNKCHRPTAESQDVPRWARDNYARQLREWADAKVGECREEVLRSEARRVPCEGEFTPCGTIRWCFECEGKVEHKYCAEAIPNNEKPEDGFPWEEGMDKWCEFDKPDPEPEPEPDPEPKDEPKNTFKEDKRCHDQTPPAITWLDITDGSAANNWHPQATWAAEGGDTMEVRFSDDPDDLKWTFTLVNDGHESLGFMHNTGLLGMVDYFYQWRTVNGCSDGPWTNAQAFN